MLIISPGSSYDGKIKAHSIHTGVKLDSGNIKVLTTCKNGTTRSDEQTPQSTTLEFNIIIMNEPYLITLSVIHKQYFQLLY